MDPSPSSARSSLALTASRAGQSDGGIAVSALVPEQESLEDVFVALVEGEETPR